MNDPTILYPLENDSIENNKEVDKSMNAFMIDGIDCVNSQSVESLLDAIYEENMKEKMDKDIAHNIRKRKASMNMDEYTTSNYTQKTHKIDNSEEIYDNISF
jgi:hypothetical protein